MKVWLDGQLVNEEDAKLSVFDHGTLYGDGVFEGIRAYAGKIFQCDAHLDRLFRSAEMIGLKIPFTKQQLADATYACLAANGLSDAYIRMVVTRGPGNLGINPNMCPKACAYIITGQIKMYPPEMYENGMPVIIAKTLRTTATMLSPKIKSLNYLNNIQAKMEGNAAGVPEVLMKNVEGNIAEASGDNVFIIKDGKLITPPTDAGILVGITREVVLRIAEKLGITTEQANITPQDVYAADECFLTGTAAEVIPVTSVDGIAIADGKVGPTTKKLYDAFHEFTQGDEQVAYTE